VASRSFPHARESSKMRRFLPLAISAVLSVALIVACSRIRHINDATAVTNLGNTEGAS